MESDATAIRAEKQALRSALRERREALAPSAGSAAAQEAGHAAARWAAERLVCRRRVALYRAFGREFDPAPLGAVAAAGGATLCYPRVATRRPPRLTFHEVRDEARLERAWFGALEPAADEPLVDDMDVLIVPGLGFDLRGNRLGQGGGFYDSALRARPGALRIAPCYGFQIVEAVPREAHDEPVDLIVTPEGARQTFARPHFSPGAGSVASWPECRTPDGAEPSRRGEAGGGTGAPGTDDRRGAAGVRLGPGGPGDAAQRHSEPQED